MIRLPWETAWKRIQDDVRLQYLLLVFITLFAGALRFYKLGAWSLWVDEIFTINRATIHYPDLTTALRTIRGAVWIPTSVILTSGALNVLGVSAWSARLVPAIIGTLTIPILHFPIKKLWGGGVALTAALLLAVSPWHITWSQNARFYTLLFLLYILSLFALHWGLEKDRARYFFLFLILFFFALSERMTAIFLVPAVAVYLLLLALLPFDKPPGLRWRNIGILLIPVVAGGILETVSFLTRGESRFFADMDWFFQYQVESPVRMLSYISFNIGLPLLVMGIFGGLYLLRRKNRLGLLMLLGALTPLGLVLLLNPFMYTEDRYVFPALACWVILAAFAVKEIYAHVRLSGKILATGVLCILLFHALGDNLLYYTANNGNRPDWKGAFSLARGRSQEGDQFVAWWPEFAPFYLPGKEITPWETLAPDTVTASGARYWFILDQDTIWANLKMRDWVLDHAELVEVFYLRMPDNVYLKVYLYDPARVTAAP